jgi:hypothetical protein
MTVPAAGRTGEVHVEFFTIRLAGPLSVPVRLPGCTHPPKTL